MCRDRSQLVVEEGRDQTMAAGEHLCERGDFFSPLRGAKPQQSQLEGEKSAWKVGRAAAAPQLGQQLRGWQVLPTVQRVLYVVGVQQGGATLPPTSQLFKRSQKSVLQQECSGFPNDRYSESVQISERK